MPLRRPTADGIAVVSTVRGLPVDNKPGFSYVKAGVMLLGLQVGKVEQHESGSHNPGSGRVELMEALDALNDRFG